MFDPSIHLASNPKPQKGLDAWVIANKNLSYFGEINIWEIMQRDDLVSYQNQYTSAQGHAIKMHKQGKVKIFCWLLLIAGSNVYPLMLAFGDLKGGTARFGTYFGLSAYFLFLFGMISLWFVVNRKGVPPVAAGSIIPLKRPIIQFYESEDKFVVVKAEANNVTQHSFIKSDIIGFRSPMENDKSPKNELVLQYFVGDNVETYRILKTDSHTYKKLTPSVEKLRGAFTFPRKKAKLLITTFMEPTTIRRRGLVAGEFFEYNDDTYIIDREYAKGGMGIIFLATNNTTKEQIIIKQLLPHRYREGAYGYKSCEEYWLREQRIISLQSGSPGIPMHLLGALKTEDRGGDEYYLLLEFIHGQSLNKWLSSYLGGDLMPSKNHIFAIIRNLLIPLCDYLHFSHEQCIIHRDVTPKNLIIQSPSNFPVLIDWGVAKKLEPEEMYNLPKPFFTADRTAATGILSVGNPPEIIRGQRPVAASDIYMLGHIIFYLCTGGISVRLPETKNGFVLSPIKHNFDTPQEVSDLVERMTQYEPADRIRTVDQVKNALLDIID